MSTKVAWICTLLLLGSFTMAMAADSISVLVNDGEQFTTTSGVRISVANEGLVLPTEMRIKVADGEWSDWIPYSPTVDWTLPGPDGLILVSVEARYKLESKTEESTYTNWIVMADEDSIYLDTTPPVVTYEALPAANANGWNKTAVVVSFNASDSGSGVASNPGALVFDEEGAGQTGTVAVSDLAGNTTTVQVSGINIDMTPPTINAEYSIEPNANGWYSAPVVVSFDVTDSGSGVSLEPVYYRFGKDGAGQSYIVEATDKAGNLAKLAITGINIDTTAPTVVVKTVDPGYADDIWTSGPVTLDIQASDSTSGVASSGYLPVGSARYLLDGNVLSEDGANQVARFQAVDNAGNTSVASVSDINIDASLPTTTVLLQDSEGVSGAEINDAVEMAVDLKSKLDAFGDYDPKNIAVAHAFVDAAGLPLEDLSIAATMVAIGDNGKPSDISAYSPCKYAPVGGFYYFVLPSGKLTSGKQYEVWFEGAGQEAYKTIVTIP